ncbi:MAG: 3-methyladenine DNA glycosylase AlkD [bacterium]|jgi:3-methyladenine DNA glycosylase AlkD
MHSFSEQLIQVTEPHHNQQNALQMKKYMRNQFEFLGIRSPQRKLIFKEFLQNHKIPEEQSLPIVVQELWNQEEREFQHLALELLDHSITKKIPFQVELLESIITTKSWWDTIDWIATRLVSACFKKNPLLIQEYTPKWMDSKNIWLQRTVLLFQLKYKQNTDFDFLSKTIQELANSEEFFIQKAIGWTLREYSKTNPTKIIQFVNENTLSKLSYREAIKVLSKEDKKQLV